MQKVCRFIEDQCAHDGYYTEDQEDLVEDAMSSLESSEDSEDGDSEQYVRRILPQQGTRKRSRRILDSDDDDADGRVVRCPRNATCLDDESTEPSDADDDDSFIDDRSLADLSLWGQSDVEEYVSLVSEERTDSRVQTSKGKKRRVIESDLDE